MKGPEIEVLTQNGGALAPSGDLRCKPGGELTLRKGRGRRTSFAAAWRQSRSVQSSRRRASSISITGMPLLIGKARPAPRETSSWRSAS